MRGDPERKTLIAKEESFASTDMSLVLCISKPPMFNLSSISEDPSENCILLLTQLEKDKNFAKRKRRLVEKGRGVPRRLWSEQGQCRNTCRDAEQD